MSAIQKKKERKEPTDLLNNYHAPRRSNTPTAIRGAIIYHPASRRPTSCIMPGAAVADGGWRSGTVGAPAACCRPGCLSHRSPPVTALHLLLLLGSHRAHTPTCKHTDSVTYSYWQKSIVLVRANSFKTNKPSRLPSTLNSSFFFPAFTVLVLIIYLFTESV